MQESTAKTAAEWVFVARSVAQLPGGESLALRSVARAGMAAQNVADWLTVAKVWAQDFDDTEMAKHCMEKAESDAEDTEEWVRIAKAWHNNFQDSDNLQRSVREAEEIAEGYADWVEILSVWDEVFHNVDKDILESGISHVVAAADDGGFLDMMQADLSHAARQATAVDLGFLPPQTIVIKTGIWSSEYVSNQRPGSYARFYKFTLTEPLMLSIDLSSSVDAYLYLLRADGTVLDENDDWQDGTDSRISRHLAAGTYTIEATTFGEAESGEFSLAINT